MAWGVVLASADHVLETTTASARYVALCLTGCAGVAVLGARRPGVGAWNFVVVALLAVNLLPLAEGVALSGAVHLDVFRAVCVAATLVVGILNYLPTRLAPAALLLLLGSAVEFKELFVPSEAAPFIPPIGWLAMAGVPWLAYACSRGGRPALTEFDRLWLGFRDRFGFVWAQRLRDQFNRSAANAGWPVVLGWRGLQAQPGGILPNPNAQAELVTILRALMKRFGPDYNSGSGTQ
jgi:hypothetical protein